MPIRKFEKTDIAPITDLVRATSVFREEEIDVAVELMEIAATEEEQKDYLMYVSIDDTTKVQGYYCVGPTPMTRATFDLYWIAVHPDVQGKGVGRELLSHCESLVKSHGGKLLMVETSSQSKYEPTRKFYIRNDFAEAAHIRDYYAPGDDLVIYSKHF